MSCRQYTTETKQYTQNNSTATMCNSVLFINTGSCAVTIDGLTLQPNQSWSIDGNADEMNTKVYYFNFVVGGTNPQLTIIYKRYISNK